MKPPPPVVTPLSFGRIVIRKFREYLNSIATLNAIKMLGLLKESHIIWFPNDNLIGLLRVSKVRLVNNLLAKVKVRKLG